MSRANTDPCTTCGRSEPCGVDCLFAWDAASLECLAAAMRLAEQHASRDLTVSHLLHAIALSSQAETLMATYATTPDAIRQQTAASVIGQDTRASNLSRSPSRTVKPDTELSRHLQAVLARANANHSRATVSLSDLVHGLLPSPRGTSVSQQAPRSKNYRLASDTTASSTPSADFDPVWGDLRPYAERQASKVAAHQTRTGGFEQTSNRTGSIASHTSHDAAVTDEYPWEARLRAQRQRNANLATPRERETIRPQADSNHNQARHTESDLRTHGGARSSPTGSRQSSTDVHEYLDRIVFLLSEQGSRLDDLEREIREARVRWRETGTEQWPGGGVHRMQRTTAGVTSPDDPSARIVTIDDTTRQHDDRDSLRAQILADANNTKNQQTSRDAERRRHARFSTTSSGLMSSAETAHGQSNRKLSPNEAQPNTRDDRTPSSVTGARQIQTFERRSATARTAVTRERSPTTQAAGYGAADRNPAARSSSISTSRHAGGETSHTSTISGDQSANKSQTQRRRQPATQMSERTNGHLRSFAATSDPKPRTADLKTWSTRWRDSEKANSGSHTQPPLGNRANGSGEDHTSANTPRQETGTNLFRSGAFRPTQTGSNGGGVESGNGQSNARGNGQGRGTGSGSGSGSGNGAASGSGSGTGNGAGVSLLSPTGWQKRPSWEARGSRSGQQSDSDRAPRPNREPRSERDPRPDREPRIDRAARPDRDSVERAEDLKEKRFYLELDDDVVDAPSIGPKTAARLYAAGILTVRQLLKANVQTAAEAIDGRHITADVLTDWQDQARLVCTIPWLRGTHAQMLVGAGYRTARSISSAGAASVIAAIAEFATTRQGDRVLRSGPPPEDDKITTWVENAGQAEPGRAL